MNLFDHTKLIITNDGQIVTYISKTREMDTRSLDNWVASGKKEVLDRLLYCRDIVGQMIRN
jgi:hypothetical protein